MYTPKEIADVVEKLFKPSWRCSVAREYLSMLREVPDQLECEKPPELLSGYHPDNRVTRTETNPNMQGIIELLYGVPHFTADMHKHKELNLLGPQIAQICIADIAEVVYRRGQVELLNPRDSVEIHETVGMYLKQIDHLKVYDPHYKSPPEEDIEAFRKLFNMLDNFSRRYISQGLGNSPMAVLETLMRKTLTVARTVDKDKDVGLTLDGHFNEAKVGLSYKGGSPYAFK